MGSSNWNLKPPNPLKPKDTPALIRCSLRGIPLRPRPEEILRERIVQELLALGYPRAYLAIEVPLKALCRLSHQEQEIFSEVPNRRVDLVAYMQNPCKEEGGLIPLLLIECKASAFTARGWRQLLGYQHHVSAPFIALITQTAYYFHALSALQLPLEAFKQEQPIRLNKLPAFASLVSLCG